MHVNSLPMRLGLTLLFLTAGAVSASTISVSDGYGMPGDTAVLVTVSLENTTDYAGAELVVQYNSDLLELNRAEPAGSVVSLSDAGYYEYALGKVSMVVFDVAGTSLPADTGVIFNLYFDVPAESLFEETQITISEMIAVRDDLTYDAVSLVNGTFWIWRGFFCGDVDGDNDPLPIISDLVYLVDYMFQGGPEPPVMEAADVDCSGGVIDIADLVYLVDYMFNQGPEPCAPCSSPALEKRFSDYRGKCDVRTETLPNGDRFRLDISCDFETAVAGFQQEYSYDGKAISIDSASQGKSSHTSVKLYYHADGEKVSLGLVDIEGKGFIEPGKSHLVSIYYHQLGEAAKETPEVSHVFTKAVDRDARLLQLEVTTDKPEPNLPKRFALHQNYPNPFNPHTIIRYDLPKASNVKITIFNILGQRVTILTDGHQPAGFHQAAWNGLNNKKESVASGVYFYRIEAEGFTASKKMVLLK